MLLYHHNIDTLRSVKYLLVLFPFHFLNSNSYSLQNILICSHIYFFIVSCILNIILPILFEVLHCSKMPRFPNTWLWITENYVYYLYAIFGCIWQIEIALMISFETGNYLKIDQWWNLKVMEVGCTWWKGKMKVGEFKEFNHVNKMRMKNI